MLLLNTGYLFAETAGREISSPSIRAMKRPRDNQSLVQRKYKTHVFAYSDINNPWILDRVDNVF
ncbi:MAG: hypothetical protein IPP93_05255 [Chitinophagaceae bacterium]|nr:hypothetical protein [Chitinophagaceae bacterium]